MRGLSFCLALAALVSLCLARWERQYLPVEPLVASAVNQKDDDWQYIGTSKEDLKLYYSPDRTVEHRGLVQAWFKGVLQSAWEYPLPNSVAEMEFRQICRPRLPRRKNMR